VSFSFAFPLVPPEYISMYRPVSGRGAAWLARPSGGRKAVSSNLTGPTTTETARLVSGLAGGSVSGTSFLSDPQTAKGLQ
jgi:hypothetical protein